MKGRIIQMLKGHLGFLIYVRNLKMYDLCVIGSGPTMFGCVFKLLAEKPDSKILVIEKNAISSGGLRNDCKMNFNYRVGFPTEFWNKDNAEKYLAEVRQFLVPKIEEKKNLEHYECRSEEHTSELQSPYHLVCRLLLEKKNSRRGEVAAGPRANTRIVRWAGLMLT